jgi:pSer/pThr/pTyr-binding forkhead associated (FHA) protein
MSDVTLILRKTSDGIETVVIDGLIAGRLAESGLVLTEGHPSRQHAKFSVSGTEVKLEDLGSANGTFVNDKRITTPVVLRSGDKVRFDVEEFEYRIPHDKTVATDAQQTIMRKIEDIDVEGSGIRERPAWIDPDKQSAGGPKTEFIDSASLKRMMQDGVQGAMEMGGDVNVPVIIVSSGAKSGMRVNLKSAGEQGEWTIGSDVDRDIVLEDQGVSGVHAKLTQDGRRWKLTDQMSANGTFVNGKRSNMSYLDNGDRIRFGPVECIFRTPVDAGSATRQSRAVRPPGSKRNILLAGIAFAVTLAVLFVLFKFVL